MSLSLDLDHPVPLPVDSVIRTFGAPLSYLPPMEAIPEEFVKDRFHTKNKWVNLMNKVFFEGVAPSLSPKEGIDPQAAWDHIHAVLISRSSKHEHKEAGVAYLFSLWYDDVVSLNSPQTQETK